jgi:DNA-binding transcriptional ArsR family regulator
MNTSAATTTVAKLSDLDLDAAFAALADRTRRAILARLTSGDASVMELAAPFAMSQPAISKHLQVLERAGLISRSRDAQRRPCHLEPQRLQAVSEWLGSYRDYWEASYGRLDQILEALQTEAKAESKAKEKPRERKKPRNRRPAR